MRSAIRKIGNSSAVIIPKPILAHLGAEIGDAIDLSLEKDHIILSCPKHKTREGWAQAAKRIVEAGEDNLGWSEFGNADDENLRW